MLSLLIYLQALERGCDFAGQIVTVGPVLRRNFLMGDGVCGCVFGNNPEAFNNGVFAENVVVPGDLVFKIPPTMSLQMRQHLDWGCRQ